MKTLNSPSSPRLPRLALALALSVALFHIASAQKNPGEKRKMLSKHQTVAQFAAITEHKCLGLTALCPDKCGQSGDMATFRILKYLAYEKPGQYGDEQQKRYQFLVQDNMKNPKVSAEVKAAIDALKPDDYVLLDWQHDYVSKAGANYPERTVLQLKRITREEADKLMGGLDKLPKEEPKLSPQPPGNQAAPKVR
jgi:hypothetical protein